MANNDSFYHDHGALDAIPLRFSDKFKPPPKVTLPFGWKLSKPPADLLESKHDFTLENSVLASLRQKRNATVSADNVVDIGDSCNTYENSQLSSNAVVSDNNHVIPPSNLPLVPPMSNDILQPVDVSKQTTVNNTTNDETQRNTSSWAEFELDNSSPFELVELQSINDMDALKTVLLPDSTHVRASQSLSKDSNISKISQASISSESTNGIWLSQSGNDNISERTTSQYEGIIVLSVSESSKSTDTLTAAGVTSNAGNFQNSCTNSLVTHPPTPNTTSDNLYYKSTNMTSTMPNISSGSIHLDNSRNHQTMPDNVQFSKQPLVSNVGQEDWSRNVQLGHSGNGLNDLMVRSGANSTQRNHQGVINLNIGNDKQNSSTNRHIFQSFPTSRLDNQSNTQLPRANSLHNEDLVRHCINAGNSAAAVDINQFNLPKKCGPSISNELGSKPTDFGIKTSDHNVRSLQQTLRERSSSYPNPNENDIRLQEKSYSPTDSGIVKDMSPPIKDLTAPQQALISVMVDMGFPTNRAAKAAIKYGDDSKKVLDHLIRVENFCEKGYCGSSCEIAINEYGTDDEKVITFLKLEKQLQELGFNNEKIRTSLIKCDLDSDKAVDLLTS
ncbi:Ubiquitin-associated protein 1 [Trichoplax sp. H2]|nr:Ubiquitin-associated protein 1 [Trichoplax sp. H2]|eukprot:RDD46324.1 Ubiquitin-associated protein 1 [Trichoplax sp. H2]